MFIESVKSTMVVAVLFCIIFPSAYATERVSVAGDTIRGIYMIENLRHGSYLKSEDMVGSGHASLLLSSGASSEYHFWQFEYRPDLAYRLRNMNTGKAIQAESGKRTGIIPVVLDSIKKSNMSCQFWRFVPMGKDLYRISNIAGDMTLTAVQKDPNGHIGIFLMPWMNKDEQKWKLVNIRENSAM